MAIENRLIYEINLQIVGDVNHLKIFLALVYLGYICMFSIIISCELYVKCVVSTLRKKFVQANLLEMT